MSEDIDLGRSGTEPSARAGAVLEHILNTELGASAAEKVTVTEALSSHPILDHDTGRTKARVALVTTNEQVLVRGSLIQKEYRTLAPLFDELHILVLIPRSGRDSFERVAENVWIYQIHHKHWWKLPKAALNAARAALVFNENIRPDVIIGIDPFEAGLGAWYIARDFERPLQLHLETNFFEKLYPKLAKGNWWRRRMANYVLKRTGSVRTKTDALRTAVAKAYPSVFDTDVLPRFYNFAGLASAVPTINLHEKYKDFSFIMLTFGPLRADSHLHDIFIALNKTLQNPRIGLIVVGDGPAKQLFEDKAKLLHIERSVVFVSEPEDLASYLKTADLLVMTSTDQDSETIIMQAAAAGLPIMAYETELRRDLFQDGRSALLCQEKDLLTLTQKVTLFINNVALRVQLRSQAQAVASTRLQENAEGYFEAYRATIEKILVVPESDDDGADTKTEETAAVATAPATLQQA